MRFKDVLVAIDGSPASFRAAELGSQIAAAEGGTLELLAVAGRRKDLAGKLGIGGDEDPDQERLRREADVRSAAAVLGPGAPIRSTTVVEGPIAETILERCGACDEDTRDRLICMGSGRHKLRLGSVSSEVLRGATCPVLVVREGSSRSPRVQRILVGFDGTQGAWSAIEAAAELSKQCGAEVHLVQVLRPSFPMPARGMPLGEEEMQQLAGEPERKEIREAADRITEAGGAVAKTLFELGRPHERLLAQAEGQTWT